MSQTITWSETTVVSNQSLLMNGAPKWQLSSRTPSPEEGMTTSISGVLNGNTLGQIDWRKRKITIEGKEVSIDSVRKMSLKSMYKKTRVWKWSEQKYEISWRWYECDIESLPTSKSPSTATFKFPTGQTPERMTATFTFNPSVLDDNAVIFLILAGLYTFFGQPSQGVKSDARNTKAVAYGSSGGGDGYSGGDGGGHGGCSGGGDGG